MGLNLSKDNIISLLEELDHDKQNIKRVISFLKSEDIETELIVHKKSSSADRAAESLETDLSAIVKSLLFVGDDPVLALVQGNKQVSRDKLGRAVGEDKLNLASPEQVKDITGYRVGGVSPFDLDIDVIIDEDIMELDKAYPAAGSTSVGVKIKPEVLKQVTGAEIDSIST